MSLYGALYSSVSGIKSQGTAIGIISDNISNVNTVGYKAGSQYFSTLVTSSGSTSSYSPGGVRAQNRQLVTQQGLLQTSNSPLDIAISGDGMFVVQDKFTNDGTEKIAYTRAGSFKKDSLGNFQNAQGYFLKAWKLDADGNVIDSDGTIQNDASSLDTLQVVNIGAASGDASATTQVTMGLNLKADQSILEGAGDILKPGEGAGTGNSDIQGDNIIVPNANMVSGDELKIQINGSTDTTYNFEYGGFVQSDNIATTTLFGQSNATSAFSGGSITDGDNFKITLSDDTGNPLTFTFKATDPKTANGEFNSLATLAEAIDKTSKLTARVVTNTNGTRLYVSANDANVGLTFADVTGTVARTIFDDAYTANSNSLTNIVAVGSDRWNTLEGLANLLNSSSYKDIFGAEVIGTKTSNAQIKIYNKDPLTTISFDNASGNSGDILDEFGIDNTVIDAAYNAASTATNNMSAGGIKPHYEQTIRVYDSLGNGHDIRAGFIKVASNTWRAELYAAKEGDLFSDATMQIGAGEITFNGNGSLQSIDSTLTTDIDIDWASEAEATSLDIDWGTAGTGTDGKTNGLRQFSGFYNNYFITQNGAGAGLLDSVTIDSDGFITANFNNGDTQKLYKIPLAKFANPDGMISKNGNLFIQSVASGEVNLKSPGEGGVGAISPSSLESANTELSEELTDMIVAQRAYQASAKVITTADQLLDDLNRAT